MEYLEGSLRQIKTMGEIQKEIGRWSEQQFGMNVSKDEASVSFGHPLGSIPALLGVGEEYGELIRPTIYRHQGRGFSAEEAQRKKEDAVADLLIYLLCYCSQEGIQAELVLNAAWEKVSKRTQANWLADKAREDSPSPERAPDYLPDTNDND